LRPLDKEAKRQRGKKIKRQKDKDKRAKEIKKTKEAKR
jgi:hypothetical protein